MCHESQSYPRSCHRALLLTYQSAHTLTHAYCKKPNQMTDKLSSGLLLIGGQMLLLQLRNTQGPYILTFHKHVWRYQCNVSKASLFKLRSPKKTNKQKRPKENKNVKKKTNHLPDKTREHLSLHFKTVISSKPYEAGRTY